MDLVTVVRAVTTYWMDTHPDTPIDLEITTDRAEVQGDAERLRQVIDNLLSNAIKYGADKPIAVRLSREGGASRWPSPTTGEGSPARRSARSSIASTASPARVGAATGSAFTSPQRSRASTAAPSPSRPRSAEARPSPSRCLVCRRRHLLVSVHAERSEVVIRFRSAVDHSIR